LGGAERATSIAPISELAEKRTLLSAGFRYVLKTDVSTFFPSIYTHSIPWALHGKAAAKANQRNYTSAFFGNILDYLMQRCQERQTMGIPIGPDTSHIISEVIGTSIDLMIKENLGKWPDGYRHVDDFFLCFQTFEDAEHALSVITRSLGEFELRINAGKTHIVEVQQLEEDSWSAQLRSFSLSVDDDFLITGEARRKAQRKILDQFFDLSFVLAKRHDDENVMKYALRKSASVLIEEDNWNLYQAYLLRAARAYQNTLQTVTHILATYNQLGYNLDRKKISLVCHRTILECAPLERHSEVLWALWLAKELEIKIRGEVASKVVEMSSSICALAFLDLREVGLIPKAVATDYWKQQVNAHSLRNEWWLLAYEASQKGWLRGRNPTFVSSDALFLEMSNLNISFYDTNARLKPLITRRTVVDDWGGIHEDWEFEDVNEEYVA